MNSPDLTNGIIESIAGVMQWTNVLALYRDKQVRGMNLWSVAFYCGWGLWGAWYYPNLDQWWSAVGNFVILSSNLAWLWLALKYTAAERRNHAHQG